MSDPAATTLAARVTIGVTVDLEPMLRASIRAAKRQHLGIDEVTESDMQKAREAFGARNHREERAPDPALLERIRRGLPAGVTLVELLDARDGSTSICGSVLQVDDLALLPTIVLDNNPEAGQPPARPFEKFTVERQGTTLEVVGALDDPGVGVEGGEQSNPLFSSVKMWLKVELSSKPRRHNAARVEGNALLWELVLGADLKARGGRKSVPVELQLSVP